MLKIGDILQIFNHVPRVIIKDSRTREILFDGNREDVFNYGYNNHLTSEFDSTNEIITFCSKGVKS